MKRFVKIISFILLLTALLTAPSFAASGTEQEWLFVMTYNVLDGKDEMNKRELINYYESLPETTQTALKNEIQNNIKNAYKPAHSRDCYESRLNYISEMIHLTARPDIIGIQEASAGDFAGRYFNWVEGLKEKLSDMYECRYLSEDVNIQMNIASGLMIFYDKNRFALEEAGGEAYEVDPNVRAYHYVKLFDRNTNESIYVFNTHLSLTNSNKTEDLQKYARIRAQECNYLYEKVTSIADGHPYYVTGDFNIRDNQENKYSFEYDAYADLRAEYAAKGGFCNPFAKKEGVADALKGICYPRSDANYGKEIDQLDHIYYNTARSTLDQSSVERGLAYSLYNRMSDHEAYLAKFKYNYTPSGNTPSVVMTRPVESAAASGSGDLITAASSGTYTVSRRFDKKTITYYVDRLNMLGKGNNASAPFALTLKAGTSLYKNAACTAAVDPASVTTGDGTTASRYYLKNGSETATLYVRGRNTNKISGEPGTELYVDPAIKALRVQSGNVENVTALYQDLWFTVGVQPDVNGFTSIQAAVDYACAHPENKPFRIYVAPGTYKENIVFTGNCDITFYGSCRNKVTALTAADAENGTKKYTVNSARSGKETVLDGSITYYFPKVYNSKFNAGDTHTINTRVDTTCKMEVNGFKFIGEAPRGSICVDNGNLTCSRLDLAVRNNLFYSCSRTTKLNGAAVRLFTGEQKKVEIEDNYFKYTACEINGWTKDVGKRIFRALHIRNLGGSGNEQMVSVKGNLFDGYDDYNNMFFLSSEVSDGKTDSGYGKLRMEKNEMKVRNSYNYNTGVYVRHICGSTTADIVMDHNRFMSLGNATTNPLHVDCRNGSGANPNDPERVTITSIYYSYNSSTVRTLKQLQKSNAFSGNKNVRVDL